jgi:hypothetical protein
MTAAAGQDPLKSLPEAYKLRLENDWVKVTRVHYAPHEKLPPHQHTLTGSAYVYLNDSGPVIFKHIGLAYGAVTRPPTKTGCVRLYQGLTEIHEVENQSDLPSDFLRIEFKTEPVNEKSLRGRFFRETYPEGENFQKVQFENEQVRITRLVCAAGKTLEFSTGQAEPALLVSLSPSSFKVTDAKGKTSPLSLDMGQERFIGSGQRQTFQNTGSGPAEFLRFDFKTKPLPPTAAKPNTHEHPKQ